MPVRTHLKTLSSYVLVSLLASSITFQLTRPSIAQVPTGPLHIATTPCIASQTGTAGSDVPIGFAGDHVVAYVGAVDCGINSQVRYIILYQN